MRIRRRATLVCTFEDTRTVVHDFLSQTRFETGGAVMAALRLLDDWQDIDTAMAEIAAETGDAEQARDILKGLLDNGLLIIEDSPEADRDQQYRDNWRWGAVAGFYQFSLRDQKFLEGEEIVERMESYQAEGDAPPLLTTNRELSHRIPLPDFTINDPFFRELHLRASNREFSGKAIALDALADCLFAANGVKNIHEYGAFGELPKTMTPSGGARNPIELYVYVRAVEGLDPGFYHYSALDHDLGFLHADELPEPVELLGTQTWTNKASAVVFMVADFERTAWKYRQPLAWRVVLMETGYIGQNLLLAANYRDLAAAPTGALSESRVEALLGLEPIRQAALFAIVLGDPASR